MNETTLKTNMHRENRTPAEKLGAVLDAVRPSPMEFAGFVTGGTIGAYAAGPIGTIIGMFGGGLLFYLAERAIDRNSPSRPMQ